MPVHPAIQPILCVIGNPVAGNPMQFAMERALEEAQLDWKFVSMDVKPDVLDVALRGAKALGIAGIAIASPYEMSITDKAVRDESSNASLGWVDCLQKVDGQWISSNQLGRAVVELARQATAQLSHACVFGHGNKAIAVASAFVASGISCSMLVTPDHDSRAHQNHVAQSIDGAISFVESIPLDSQTTGLAMVLTDSDEHRDSRLKHIPESFGNENHCLVDLALHRRETIQTHWPSQQISGVDVVVRSIANYFSDWTKQQPNLATIREAVEEYFEL